MFENRRESRINIDQFPKRGGSEPGMLPWKMFGILTPYSFLFWVSDCPDSFRQDIGQFHCPMMKPCKSADYLNYFIKFNFSDFNLESFFY